MIAWLFDRPYGPADLASIAGLIVSIVGFCVTIVGVARTRNAAGEAARAARATRRGLRFVATVVDLTALVSDLEMVKGQHRRGEWQLSLCAYSSLRRRLIQVRTSNPFLAEDERAEIQALSRSLFHVEQIVEHAVERASEPPTAHINAILSRQIDGIVEVLAEVSQRAEGAR